MLTTRQRSGFVLLLWGMWIPFAAPTFGLVLPLSTFMIVVGGFLFMAPPSKDDTP